MVERPASGRSVILAADHRARGIVTVERYEDLLDALRAALPHCDGIMATTQPLADLVSEGSVGNGQRKYLSLNRTGLANSIFELDDRCITSVEDAAERGYTGVKIMTRIDLGDPRSAEALELLGRVLEDARRLRLEVLVEPLVWKDGKVDRSTEAVVLAAAIAGDMGAPLLKVPVPEASAGQARVEAARRVTESVGVPVMFLGGPRNKARVEVLLELADGMAGGGAGAVMGRAVYQDPDPSSMARLVADLVHDRVPVDELLSWAGSLGRSTGNLGSGDGNDI